MLYDECVSMTREAYDIIKNQKNDVYHNIHHLHLCHLNIFKVLYLQIFILFLLFEQKYCA